MPDAQSSAKPDNTKPLRTTGPSLIRSVVLYLIVAAAAAGISGWYLFSYVPSKLQYFLGMRFRTLAVAAGQFRSKTEALSAALKTAETNASSGKDKYLGALVPDLKKTLPDGFKLDEGCKADCYQIAYNDLVAQASAATQSEFDDLILADRTGHVVWQRERTTPRIGSLPALLEPRGTATGWSPFSPQWSIQTTPFKVENRTLVMPDTAASNTVNLDGQTSVLLTQPVAVQMDKTKPPVPFYLAALVSRSALEAEAMHVPTEWVVLALVPFALVFLSLPFIKLATITSKERYSFGDVVALGACTILVAAVGGALPFLVDSPASESDESLSNFADAIDRHLGAEVAGFIDLTKTIKAGIKGAAPGDITKCLTPVNGMNESVCSVWRVMPSIGGRPNGFAELDVIWWLGDDGWQKKKWTAKNQLTGLIAQDFQQHFKDILAKRTWTLKTGDGRNGDDPFTIEPLRSQTTSELAFVFAVPNNDPGLPMLAINVKPQSLVDPLVPPGYGFAVLAPDGRVLFHSTSALSLEENFLLELGETEPIAAAIPVRGTAAWMSDYHGRRHRLYTRPVDSLRSCPWRIVTFRETERLLAFSSARQSATVVLFCANAFVLLCLAAMYFFAQRVAGRGAKDVLMALMIQVRNPEITKTSIMWLGGVVAILLGAIVASYYVGPGKLDWLYHVFIDAPVIAIVLVALSRHLSKPPLALPEYDRWEHGRAAAEVFLIALVLGALPAAGMARLAHRVNDLQRDAQWLRLSREQAVQRERRVRSLVEGAPNYTRETKRILLDSGFAKVRTRSDELYSYQDQLQSIDLEDPAQDGSFKTYTAPQLERGLGLVRSLLSSSTVTTPPIEIAEDLEHIRLADSETNGLRFRAAYNTGSIRDLRPGPAVGGVLILIATFLLVRWSKHALTSHRAPRALSIHSAIRQVEAGGPNTGILVIGPARNEKDRIASDAVRSVTSRLPEIRIWLLDVVITQKWVDDEIARADTLKAAAGSGWLWIQVSNLETQLVDKNSRKEIFRLLEKLGERKPDVIPRPRPVGLIVTTTVDPTAHFTEVFQEERQEIYENAVPEVELNRSSVLLSRFRRCYVAVDGRNPWSSWYNYEPSRWQDTLELETSNHRLLAAVGVDLQHAWAHRQNVAMDELRRAVRVRAEACYQLLWTSCTRSEKLVLIQLAQEGLINPKSSDTVDELIAKGLVWPGAAPAIFNLTFRDFLRGIERTEVVQQWESMEGNGLWVISGRLVASVLMVGGLFYLFTQGISVQSVLPIISGSGFLGIPVVKSLSGLFSAKKDNANL